MNLRRLRAGELLALAGAVLRDRLAVRAVVRSPVGNLDAWDTFGAAVVLMLAALCAGLALVVSA